MTHLTEEQLVAFAEKPEGPGREHVRTCRDCAAAVNRITLLTQILTPANASLPPALARAVDEQVDARSAIHTASLDDQRLHTTGGVRALLEHLVAVRENDPQEALAFVERAASILGALDPRLYPGSALPLLRVAVLRETANTLRYLGRYREGLAVLDEADAVLQDLLVGGFEEARVAFTRATMLWKLREDTSRAEALARSAADTFRDYGDNLRALHAEFLLAGILFQRREYARAREAFAYALTSASDLDDEATLARAHHNLATCEQELAHLPEAAAHYEQARALFEHLGMTVESLRAEWNLALLSLRTGHNADGTRRLRAAAEGFRRLGNPSDAALVSLDLVEYFASTGAVAEAEAVLRGITPNGLPTNIVEHLSLIVGMLESPRARQAIVDARELLRASLD
jgi:tetratricopeptide (TPR) repeat protein